MRVERALAVSFLIVTGCPATKSSEGLQTTPITALFDRTAFVCEAMPVLIRHCSYLACHGNELHAFRVYSPGKLRLGDTATRTDRDALITNDEIEANYQSAAGVLLQDHARTGESVDVQQAPLLLKPLKASFGGAEHHGIGIFPQPPALKLEDDPEWTHLVDWVAGFREPTPATADCQNLLSNFDGGS